eukprot:4210519-Pyramimonas_sp.AAC.1
MAACTCATSARPSTTTQPSSRGACVTCMSALASTATSPSAPPPTVDFAVPQAPRQHASSMSAWVSRSLSNSAWCSCAATTS